MQKERRRNKEVYERHVRRQLEIIQERSETDPNKTYDVRNPDKPAQLLIKAQKIAGCLATDKLINQHRITELQFMKLIQ